MAEVVDPIGLHFSRNGQNERTHAARGQSRLSVSGVSQSERCEEPSKHCSMQGTEVKAMNQTCSPKRYAFSNTGLLALIFITHFVLSGALRAHEQGVSYSTLTISNDQLKADFALRRSDLAEHFNIYIDTPDLGKRQTNMEFEEIDRYIKSHVTISADRKNLKFSPLATPDIRSPDELDHLIQLSYTIELDRLPSTLSLHVDFSDPLGEQHTNFVQVIVDRKIQQGILANNESMRFKIGGRLPISTQIRQFIWLGGEHIFIGYDHILFLLCLVLTGCTLRNPKRTMIDLLKIITAFTLAHSITLALAAFGVITPPPRLIEAAIALSIIYVAAENFWIKSYSHRWIITFFFGLVHGFGFANVLRDLELPQQGFAISLFSFNLGVEIGQIIIVTLVFPFTLWLARQSYQTLGVRLISAGIMICGMGWLIERTTGLEFVPW